MEVEVDDRGDYNSSPCASYRRAKNVGVLHCKTLRPDHVMTLRPDHEL